MKLLLAIGVTVFLFAPVIQGLKCWECANAENDADCLKRGKLVTCRLNEENCFTEIRQIHNKPFKKTIFRRCKQDEACGNNYIQNPRPAWMPSQCNAIDGSVCRCCCGTDGCNSKESTSCVRSPIPDLPRCEKDEEIANGHGHCQVYYDKVICHYICKKGFVMDGNPHTLCRHSDPENRTPKPKCKVPEPGTCDDLTAPLNGDMICSNDKHVQGAECAFSCDKGYRMSGQSKLTCIKGRWYKNLRWDHKVPTCILIECPVQSPLRRVVADCTNSNLYGSVCTYRCQEEHYEPTTPTTVMTTKCQWNGKWSHPPPCCRFPCPPKTVMDLIVVLDSSSSVKQKNWDKMIKFTSGVFSQFLINEKFTQIFVMRYNKHVDMKNQLFLRNNETQEECLKALQTIPYDGKGTRTGNAMRYVKDNMLQRDQIRNDKPHVVLLITDGIAQDKEDLTDVSRQIRNTGVEIYAVGIGDARITELITVTGSIKKVWNDVKDFKSLTVEAAKKIGNYICKNSCN